MRVHVAKHCDLEDKLFKWSFTWARKPYR